MDLNRPHSLLIVLLVLLVLFCMTAPSCAEAPYKKGMPYVTASINPYVISPGQASTIKGVATGSPSPGIAVWVLGPDLVKYSVIKPKSDSTYTFKLTATETKKMTYGMYYIVIQHPMYNKKFDVYPNKKLNLIQTIYPRKDTKVAALSMKTGDAGLVAIKALSAAIKDNRVDDTYTKVQLLIDTPTCLADESTCVVE
jgi:hypothetical protein